MRISLAFLFLASSAFAQQPVDGTYAVTWKSQRGADQEAALVLAGTSGKYQFFPRSMSSARNDPCLAREHGVTVEKAEGEELVVAINASQTIGGCSDNRLTLRRVADGRYEGAFAGGTKVTVTRK